MTITITKTRNGAMIMRGDVPAFASELGPHVWTFDKARSSLQLLRLILGEWDGRPATPEEKKKFNL
jgi:hypothetical protein